MLGCILLKAEVAMPECLLAIPSGTDIFFDLRHRLLYERFLEMYEKREPIDNVSIFHHLKARGLLTEVGGLPYVASLPDLVPSEYNIGHYLSILTEKRQGRAILRICGAASESVWSAKSAEQQLSEFESRVLSLRQEAFVEYRLIQELCARAVDRMEAAFQKKGVTPGLETGFVDLDKMTRGLKPQELIIVAARPMVGKSAFAMNIVEHVAVQNKIPVGVFSLEMSADSLIQRSISSLSRTDSARIDEGALREGDVEKLTTTVAQLSKSPIHIIDKGGLTIRQMHARAKRLTHQHGIKLWIVDYLQLLKSDRKGYSRYEDITDVSNGLKEMAKDLEVPVIALAQISRDVEKNNRKPRLSDLRDSGAIEQDADIVLFLHRTEVEYKQYDETATPTEGIVAKHRNGPCGPLYFTFFPKITRFEAGTKPGREPMPTYDND